MKFFLPNIQENKIYLVSMYVLCISTIKVWKIALKFTKNKLMKWAETYMHKIHSHISQFGNPILSISFFVTD